MSRFIRPARGIKDTHYAFTVRLAPTLYAQLADDAEKNKRSIAAQVELIMENRYEPR